jgi:unsaturated rhamnogalacturonyl hydrolase
VAANRFGHFVSLALLSAALTCTSTAHAAGIDNGSAYWGPWPEKSDPVAAGKKVVENLIPRPLPWDRTAGIDYREICTAYGSLRFCAQIQDQALLDKLVQRYQIILTDRGRSLVTRPINVDSSVFGIMPLEIYLLTASDAEKSAALTAVKQTPPATAPADARAGRGAGGAGRGARGAAITNAQQEAESQWAAMNFSHQDIETRLLALGKGHADAQWASPRPDGLTDQTRMWVDDMFMITGIECQAFRATGDPVYLDRAAKEMVVYLDQLQQPNGLFFHAPDSQFYWGRGNGWFAVGMAELLSDLPATHPQRARIVEGYKKMMAGLLKYQAPSGMWRQLIDHPEAWEETSGTGMFTFAMATGVRQGWLDEATYKVPAKKAWIALSSHINDKGEVTDVCVGTNKAAQAAPPLGLSYLDYYLQRPHNQPGDYHGQAGYIWAAWAMLHDPAQK